MEKLGIDLKRQSSVSGDSGKPPMSRRSSFSARAAIPTFKFSAALDQAAETHQEEDAFNFEHWRVQMKRFFTHSRFGRYYENALIFLSVISCLECIYETYLHDSVAEDRAQLDVLQVVELGFAIVFGFDWLLSFLMAEHRTLYVTSFYSVVDLMTVVPIFVTYDRNMPNVNYIRTFHEAGLYCAFAMGTTRILRALRIRRKLARIQDAVERFMGELVLAVIVMILFFALVMQFLEETYQPHDYHTWMYYIWVTVTTVGYGDITPKSTQGRIAVMCIIGFAIVSIPKLTNELIEKMALQSVYMRNVYAPKSKKSKHVVICGDISSTSLDEFFEELFHEDHENVDLNAILLLPVPPTTEMILLLKDSAYSFNLLYLEGSALVDKDLRRARAQNAVAIFIMTNKFSDKPDEEDAKSILLNLSIKRYVTSFSLPPKLFCMQLIRPQNRRHLAREEGDELSANDLVVCLNEIKMGVLAKAVMYPGANTLLMNLISSFSDDPPEVEEGEQEEVAGAGDAGGKTEQVSSKAWLEEYQKGCDWEIYTTPLAKIFEGAKFCELAYALYDKIGVVLFALQITDAKQGASKLLLNPANFVIPSQDLFKIEAFVIAQNKASSDLSFTNIKMDATHQALRNIEAGFQSLSRVNRGLTSLGGLRKTNRPGDVDTQRLEHLRTTMKGGNGDSPEIVQPEAKTAASRWKALKRSNLVEKKVESFSYQEILHQLEDQHMKREYYLRGAPADIATCMVKTSVIDEVPFINNHVIIIGKNMSNLYDLVRPLRAKFLGMLRFIVIITPDDIPHDVWTKIAHFDAILIVRGSALEEANLRRAGIFRCAQVVVLADGTSDTTNIGMEALVDSDAIFSYQLVKRMNAGTQVVVEIVNTSNISYLDSDGSTTGAENYKFTPQFAAGNLFTTSLLDSIVCQAYYNPSIIKVVNRLISGVDSIEATELAAEATARVAQQMDANKTPEAEANPSDSDSGDSDTFDTNAPSKPKISPNNKKGGRGTIIGMTRAKVASTNRIKDIKGSCLYQMSIPDNFNERTYGKLFQRLSSQGLVPLGLLRGTFAGLSVGPRANRTPYVYTNPDKDTEIFKCDKVFVLSTKPLQPDGKLDLKDWLLNMQQNKALRAAEANPKRPGSATTTLDTLDLTQKKLDARITKMSNEMNHKMNELMKLVSQVAGVAPRGKSFLYDDEEDGDGDGDGDDEYYTLDAEGNRVSVRRRSVDSTASGAGGSGSERVEYRGASAKGNRRRMESSGSSGKNSARRTPAHPTSRPPSASPIPRAMATAIAAADAATSDDDMSKVEPLHASAKSRSLSKFAPSGILRKPSLTPDGSVSQKKRHSFSTPLTTVHSIVEHNSSFQSTTSAAGAEAAANDTNGSQQPDGAVDEDDDDSESLQSAPSRQPSIDVAEARRGDGSAYCAPATGVDATPSASKSLDDDDRLLGDEGKQAMDSRDESTRSLDSEAAPYTPVSASALSPLPTGDLDSPFKSLSRKKPAAEPIKAQTMFSPARKRADVVIDRNTISGPPIQLALNAMNNNRAFERSRAYSASPSGRRSRDSTPEPEASSSRAYSAGYARREL